MTLEMHILEREKQSLLQGRAEGIALGEKKGRAEGRAEGIAKGSHSKAVETAIKMKEKKFSTDTIAEITGLSASEIESL